MYIFWEPKEAHIGLRTHLWLAVHCWAGQPDLHTPLLSLVQVSGIVSRCSRLLFLACLLTEGWSLEPQCGWSRSFLRGRQWWERESCRMGAAHPHVCWDDCTGLPIPETSLRQRDKRHSPQGSLLSPPPIDSSSYLCWDTGHPLLKCSWVSPHLTGEHLSLGTALFIFEHSRYSVNVLNVWVTGVKCIKTKICFWRICDGLVGEDRMISQGSW